MSRTGFWTCPIISRRNLCATAACSVDVKGRNGMKSDMRPVRGAYVLSVSLFFNCSVVKDFATYAKALEKALS